jgi:hypothetical protein
LARSRIRCGLASSQSIAEKLTVSSPSVDHGDGHRSPEKGHEDKAGEMAFNCRIPLRGEPRVEHAVHLYGRDDGPTMRQRPIDKFSVRSYPQYSIFDIVDKSNGSALVALDAGEGLPWAPALTFCVRLFREFASRIPPP